MKIGIGQINTHVGNFEENAKKIEEVCIKLAEAGAELAVFPECAISGYPLKDLVFYDKFLEKAKSTLDDLAKRLPIPAIVGCPNKGNGAVGVYNSAYWIQDGMSCKICDKHLLPNYGALNDARIFDSGKEYGLVEFKGKTLGITICEDIWSIPSVPTSFRYAYQPKPLDYFASLNSRRTKRLDLLINISASVFSRANDNVRHKGGLLCDVSKFVKAPLLWCNLVGGNDEIIFAGGSGIFDASSDKQKSKCLKKFEEDFAVIDTDSIDGYDGDSLDFNGDEDIRKALVLSLRDFIKKCGLKKVLLGLSGGIDSAIVAALAVEALGAENVIGVSMPSKFSSQHSKSDALALAENLGIEFHTIPIEKLVESAEDALSDIFKGTTRDVAEENIQSRSRGLLLMAISNKRGALVLTTGNKSECAVGYCTLYGDTNGGFAPICDLYKTEVYNLSNHINKTAGREIIPQNTIIKPPSAELRPDQTDQDSLPPYDILDAILKMHIEENLSASEIIEKGFEKSVVEDVLKKVAGAEYKRTQYPIGPKISAVSYTADKNIPVAIKRGLQ